MKTQKFFFVSIFLMFLLVQPCFAQDISVHKMIGKRQSDVIRHYGKPVHRDKSNPAMDCMFYRTKSKRLTFVADQDGVYQAEATASYATKKKARRILDDFISSSVTDHFNVDTVSVNDFVLHKSGVNVQLQMCENKISKKYELRVKAHRTVD